MAVDPQGNALAVWDRIQGTGSIVQAAVRPAGGGWQAPEDRSDGDAVDPQVVFDPQGNAVAVWLRLGGTNPRVQAAGYDAAAPLLRSLSIPASGVAGKQLSFSVWPFDVWSALGATTWSFGDGQAANGTT